MSVGKIAIGVAILALGLTAYDIKLAAENLAYNVNTPRNFNFNREAQSFTFDVPINIINSKARTITLRGFNYNVFWGAKYIGKAYQTEGVKVLPGANNNIFVKCICSGYDITSSLNNVLNVASMKFTFQGYIEVINSVNIPHSFEVNFVQDLQNLLSFLKNVWERIQGRNNSLALYLVTLITAALITTDPDLYYNRTIETAAV